MLCSTGNSDENRGINLIPSEEFNGKIVTVNAFSVETFSQRKLEGEILNSIQEIL